MRIEVGNVIVTTSEEADVCGLGIEAEGQRITLRLASLPSLRAALSYPLTAQEIEEENARAERKAGDMTEGVSR